MSLQRIHSAYGKQYDRVAPPIGLLEGDAAEHAEAVVHELCHAALLRVKVRRGRCHEDQITVWVGDAVNDIPSTWLADLNEVRTLAAESLVLERMDVRVPLSTIMGMGIPNLQLFEPCHKLRLNRCLRSARRTKKVQAAADRVVGFIKGRKTL